MKTSTWLGNFLSQKRDLSVSVPDDQVPADDTYLREFSLQFTRSEVLRTCFDSDDDYDAEAFSSCDVEENPLSSIEESLTNGCDTADESLVVAKGKLKIFNLPYRIKPGEVDSLEMNALMFCNTKAPLNVFYHRLKYIYRSQTFSQDMDSLCSLWSLILISELVYLQAPLVYILTRVLIQSKQLKHSRAKLVGDGP